MRTVMIVAAVALLVTSQARAEDPELSTDGKRLLAYGTLAVMTRACNTSLTPAQSAKIKSGMEQASAAQHDLSDADFTEAMKMVGAQVGQNRAEVCGALTPEFIETSLAQAAAGE